MRSKILLVVTPLLALLFASGGCGTQKDCPVCGTDKSGTVGIIDIIPVPGANPTGWPFGSLYSFDIGWVNTTTHRFYLSDRAHYAVDVFDTLHDVALTQLTGTNGANPLACAPGIGASPRLDASGNPDPYFCSNGVFGGFPGGTCCTGRASTENPLSGPDGVVVTADGGTAFVGNADSAVVVFDLTRNPPQVIGDIPTGVSPSFGGPDGVGPCIQSPGLSSPLCGDLRADEASYDPKDHILLIANGDTGVPFVTFIDTMNPACANGSCILGQIFFDGGAGTALNSCPSNSGIPNRLHCGHGPLAASGLGGSEYNPATGHFLLTVPQNDSNPADGEIAEIDPVTANGPQIVNHFQLLGFGCQASSLAVGPAPNVLIGCANHDGVSFPPNTIVMDGGTGKIVTVINYVGGADEVWYNPGDNRYYTASRDMPNGPVLGVIDASSNRWLQNVATGSNAHSVAVDSTNSHIFVPLQPSSNCGTQSSNGCIAVYAAQ